MKNSQTVMSAEMEANGLAWTAGWHPKGVILGLGVLGGVVGAAVDAIGILFALGLIAGVAVWFWGTREINGSYAGLLEDYILKSEETAARGIEVTDASTYTLTYGSTDSSLLVKPSRTYYNTSLVLTDTSANINKGSEYNMMTREGVGGGSNRELFYDQIAAVESHQNGDYTALQIRTSGGDSLEMESSNTDMVDKALSDLRTRVRNAKST